MYFFSFYAYFERNYALLLFSSAKVLILILLTDIKAVSLIENNADKKINTINNAIITIWFGSTYKKSPYFNNLFNLNTNNLKSQISKLLTYIIV